MLKLKYLDGFWRAILQIPKKNLETNGMLFKLVTKNNLFMEE
jgi:hypothetical protein